MVGDGYKRCLVINIRIFIDMKESQNSEKEGINVSRHINKTLACS